MKGKEPFWWEPCTGCTEGHSSYWKTCVESSQWKAWEAQQAKWFHEAASAKKWNQKNRPLFDIDECRECGWISQKHFQAFMKFCKEKTND